MSKPGGKPIVKKRPFFEDSNMSISATLTDGKISSFDGTVKATGETKEFKVNSKHEILKAWQSLENWLNPIAKNLLEKDLKRRYKNRNPFDLR